MVVVIENCTFFVPVPVLLVATPVRIVVNVCVNGAVEKDNTLSRVEQHFNIESLNKRFYVTNPALSPKGDMGGNVCLSDILLTF